MKKNRILVTGGMGYIGSHTVVELVNAGYDVVIVDNLSNSQEASLDGMEQILGFKPPFEKFDLRDWNALCSLFEEYNDIIGIIHFAASKAVGESVENPLLYYDNNLNPLINLLKAQIKFGISNIVFSSSCTVYGQPDELPVTEQAHIQTAASPYGNTKQICEEILTDTISANSSLKAISLRYFNPTGAHDSAAIGEVPVGVPSNLVPFITQAAIGLREKLMVFGDDYNTRDGSCIRDYIHVVDLAKAHVIAVKRMVENKGVANYEYFNLGTGNGYSVLETIKSFEKVSGVKLNFEIAPRRAGDIEQIWADTNFANDELGWKAEKGLDEMMLSAWNWEKNYRENIEKK